jgi:hypothetical protein
MTNKDLFCHSREALRCNRSFDCGCASFHEAQPPLRMTEVFLANEKNLYFYFYFVGLRFVVGARKFEFAAIRTESRDHAQG